MKVVEVHKVQAGLVNRIVIRKNGPTGLLIDLVGGGHGVRQQRPATGEEFSAHVGEINPDLVWTMKW